MNNPLVSIIIPTYNRAHVLHETLDSVLAQTHANWECILVDDGSTDTTEEVLKSYVKKDARFQYNKRPADKIKGANSCRNYGLELSQGKFIQFLDSDDVISKNKLSLQILDLLNYQDCVSVCKWEYFTTNSFHIEFSSRREYKSFDSIKEYLDLVGEIGGFYPLHCFLIPKKIINLSGWWNENLSINQDGEFMFRVMMNVNKIIFQPDVFALYRVPGGKNTSSLKSEEKVVDLIYSWDLIEALYNIRYKQSDSRYIKNKRNDVYKEVLAFPNILNLHKTKFSKQINRDRLLAKLIRRILKKIKSWSV